MDTIYSICKGVDGNVENFSISRARATLSWLGVINYALVAIKAKFVKFKIGVVNAMGC